MCGYVEANHLALTDPEQQLIVGLLNQPKPPALMRRSILRKLTANWGRRRTGTGPTWSTKDHSS